MVRYFLSLVCQKESKRLLQNDVIGPVFSFLVYLVTITLQAEIASIPAASSFKQVIGNLQEMKNTMKVGTNWIGQD